MPRIFLEAQGQAIQHALKFLVVGLLLQNGGIVFGLHALVDEQGGVAAVVHDEIRAGAVGPGQGHFRAPPVVLKSFALPGEDLGQALLDDGCGRVVLGGENVAGGPADVRTQGVQGFDQHGRLDGHVQGAHDLEALQGLLGTVFSDAFHKAGHFPLGKLHFLPAEIGLAEIRHFMGQA